MPMSRSSVTATEVGASFAKAFLPEATCPGTLTRADAQSSQAEHASVNAELEVHDRAARDLTARQRVARLVDLLQLVAPRHHQVQRHLALLEPAHQQRKIVVRRTAAAWRTTVDLAAEQHVHGQRRHVPTGRARRE